MSHPLEGQVVQPYWLGPSGIDGLGFYEFRVVQVLDGWLLAEPLGFPNAPHERVPRWIPTSRFAALTPVAPAVPA